MLDLGFLLGVTVEVVGQVGSFIREDAERSEDLGLAVVRVKTP